MMLSLKNGPYIRPDKLCRRLLPKPVLVVPVLVDRLRQLRTRIVLRDAVDEAP